MRVLKILIHTHIHICTYICIYKNFLKTFLKQLCRINGVCRIMVSVAAILYALIAMLLMNTLVHFLPAKLMSHHTYYLFHIRATCSGNTLKVL